MFLTHAKVVNNTLYFPRYGKQPSVLPQERISCKKIPRPHTHKSRGAVRFPKLPKKTTC